MCLLSNLGSTQKMIWGLARNLRTTRLRQSSMFSPPGYPRPPPPPYSSVSHMGSAVTLMPMNCSIFCLSVRPRS